MKLVTFDDGLVGELRDDRVAELDAPSMRAYFESGADARATGAEHALEVLPHRRHMELGHTVVAELAHQPVVVGDEPHSTPQARCAASA